MIIYANCRHQRIWTIIWKKLSQKSKMADEDVKRLVYSIMKFLNKQKGNNQGEVLEQIEVAQQVRDICIFAPHLNSRHCWFVAAVAFEATFDWFGY